MELLITISLIIPSIHLFICLPLDLHVLQLTPGISYPWDVAGKHQWEAPWPDARNAFTELIRCEEAVPLS